MQKAAIVLLAALCLWPEGAAVAGLSCPACRCYAVDCTALANPDIDCEETFTGTCESRSYIADDFDCAQICDCCVAGACLTWSDYYCLVYRGYQLLSVIYFVVLIGGYFVLRGLFTHFFRVRRQWPTSGKSVDWENDPKVLNIRFRQRPAIQYKHEFDKKVSSHRGFRRAKDLFEEIEALKHLAFNNLIFGCATVALFAATAVLTGYTVFGVPSSPSTFSYVFWELNLCGVAFGLLSVAGYFYVTPYARQVLELILAFERSQKCKVQVLPRLKIVQFRFKKDKSLAPKSLRVSAGSLADIDALPPAPDDPDAPPEDPSDFAWQAGD